MRQTLTTLRWISSSTASISAAEGQAEAAVRFAEFEAEVGLLQQASGVPPASSPLPSPLLFPLPFGAFSDLAVPQLQLLARAAGLPLSLLAGDATLLRGALCVCPLTQRFHARPSSSMHRRGLDGAPANSFTGYSAPSLAAEALALLQHPSPAHRGGGARKLSLFESIALLVAGGRGRESAAASAASMAAANALPKATTHGQLILIAHANAVAAAGGGAAAAAPLEPPAPSAPSAAMLECDTEEEAHG